MLRTYRYCGRLLIVLTKSKGCKLVKRGLRIPAGLSGAAMAATLLLCLAGPPAARAQSVRPEDAAIIRHLNAAITWYRQLTRANESAGQPSDAFYLENARTLARQALQLAFQSAEVEAPLLLAERGGDDALAAPELSSQTSGQQQSIAKSVASTAAQISQTQTQIDLLNRQISGASGKKLQELIARRDSLQEQLDFNKALQEALQKLSTFMNGSARKVGGLQEEIDDLKKTVPDIFAEASGKGAAAAPTSPPANASEGSGLVSQASMVFARAEDLRAIKGLIQGAGAVSELARQVQSPLRTRLRATIDQGRGLLNRPTSQDPASSEENRQELVSLTAKFKQISSATIPLAQELILLDESQASLRQWKDSAHRGYIQSLRSFLARLGILLLGIIVVVAISELWRRVTFRYVHEARMRHQLLLSRHIVTGLLLAVVLAMGLVSEFSSLATFAGFVAAGIAVALQTLLLSVAGYFFLIGRHGVMVGDRISVSGITGDVIYVGLVRLYLTELAGAGADLHPTGRVAVISNSVLFLGIPLLTQIPGTAYAWHEVVVKLERGSDYSLAESKLLEAVNSVYSQYQGSIEEQHQAAKGSMTITPVVPSPQARVQLSDEGLDLIVRYPVVLRRETEIDSQMAKKVVEVIHSDPELKDAVGSPTIRPSVKA
jgi:small-conductance mechanosensitive channel